MRNKDITKEQLIMRSALTLIQEVGLAGLKMNDLAKHANLATGTVYIYFGSKEDLIRKLYTFIVENVAGDLQLGILPEMDTRQKIKLSCWNYVHEMIRHPEYKIFIEQFFRSPYFNENDLDATAAAKYIKPITEIIIQGQQEKVLKNTPVDLMIQLTRGALEKYAHYITYSKKELDAEEFEQVFDFIWNGSGLSN